jgi:hypothetical protein
MTRCSFWPSLHCSARAEIPLAARCGRREGLIFRRISQYPLLFRRATMPEGSLADHPTDSNGLDWRFAASMRDPVKEAIP